MKVKTDSVLIKTILGVIIATAIVGLLMLLLPKQITSSESNSIESTDELNFIYQPQNDLFVGDTYLVAVGFNNEENAKCAKLNYSKLGGDTYTAQPIDIAESNVIFSIPFDNNSQVGNYCLDSVSWGTSNNYVEKIENNNEKGYSFTVKEAVGKYDSNIQPAEQIDLSGKFSNNADSIETKFSSMMVSPEVKESVDNYRSNNSNGFVVCIDPGHGGSESGACPWGVPEKDMNLKIAQACNRELQQYGGVSTCMTRYGDDYVGLQRRAEIARDCGANLFLCLHNNAGGGNGAEVWVQHSGGWHSEFNTIGVEISNRILSRLASAFGLNIRGIFERYCTDGSTYPDGSQGDYFTVLYWSRYYSIPGILVEHAFMDGGGADAEALYNDANLDMMGVLDAQAVAEYYGFSKEPAFITYGEYNIQTSMNTNYVIDVQDSSKELAANIDINNFTDNLSQDWQISDPDGMGFVSIVNKNSGLCLDIFGARTSEDAKICQYTNKLADTQRWKIVYDEGFCKIVSKAKCNMCITVDSSTAQAGSQVKLNTYNKQNNQRFKFKAIVQPSDPNLENGYYKIVSADNTNMMFEANECDDLFWTLKTYDNPDTFTNQVFKLDNVGGFHTATDCVADSLISLNDNGAANVGNRIVQWKNINDVSQQWSFQLQSDGTYKIQSSSSCLYVGPYMQATVNRGNQLCGCANSNLLALKWKLIKVPDPYKEVKDLANKYSSLIEDGIYTISSMAGNNLVLDVAGFSTFDMGNILLYNNCGTTNQQFEVSHDNDNFIHFNNVNSQKYIDISGGTKAPIKNVCQFHKHNEGSQKWVVVPNDDGTFKIVSSLINNLCLKAETNAAVPCTNVISTYDAKDNSSKFIFNRIGAVVPPSDTDIQNGYYKIACKLDKTKVMDVVGYSPNDCANIDVWTQNDTYMNIVFHVQSTADGYHNITSVSSDKNITNENNNVIQRNVIDSKSQKWSIKKQDDGYYKIISVENGNLMSLNGKQAKDGTNVICSVDSWADNQKWALVNVQDPYESLDKLADANRNVVSEGTYVITSKAGNNLALDVANYSPYDMANILLYNNYQASNQQWVVSHDERGYVHFQNVNSGKYIDVAGESKCVGSNICQYHQHSENSQKWIVIPTDNGYEIRSGLVANYNMAASSNFASVMSNIQTSVTDNSISQRFDINAYTGKINIMSSSRTSSEQLARYYRKNGHTYPDFYADKQYGTLEAFCQACCDISALEGIDPSVMFCLMMKETGWLGYGGQVYIWQYNFGGIKKADGIGFHSFATMYDGLLGLVQHLKAYACTDPLNTTKVDPRFDRVTRGIAPCVEDLGGPGRWTPEPEYGYDIRNMILNLWNS